MKCTVIVLAVVLLATACRDRLNNDLKISRGVVEKGYPGVLLLGFVNKSNIFKNEKGYEINQRGNSCTGSVLSENVI